MGIKAVAHPSPAALSNPSWPQLSQGLCQELQNRQLQKLTFKASGSFQDPGQLVPTGPPGQLQALVPPSLAPGTAVTPKRRISCSLHPSKRRQSLARTSPAQPSPAGPPKPSQPLAKGRRRRGSFGGRRPASRQWLCSRTPLTPPRSCF